MTEIKNERIAATDQNAAEVLQTASEISQNNPVVFKEALIEKAVRKELNLSETDTITASMLEDVRSCAL